MKTMKVIAVTLIAILTLTCFALADTQVYTLREATDKCLIETEGGQTTASITLAKARELEREELGEFVVIDWFDSKFDNTALLTTNTAGVVTIMYGVDNQWQSEQKASGQRELATVRTFFQDGFLKAQNVRHGHTAIEAEIGEYYKLTLKVFWCYEEENFRIVTNGQGVAQSAAKKTTKVSNSTDYQPGPGTVQPVDPVIDTGVTLSGLPTGSPDNSTVTTVLDTGNTLTGLPTGQAASSNPAPSNSSVVTTLSLPTGNPGN